MGFNKLVADYQGKPLAAHAVDAVLAAGLPSPLVALGHEAEAVKAALAGRAARFILAEDHGRGMGHSLASAIREVPDDWQAVLVMLADMPHVSPDLIGALAAHAAPDALMAPSVQGRRGHPVLFGRDWYPALGQLNGDEGARQVLVRHADRLSLLDWADAAVLRDADVPADLVG